MLEQIGNALTFYTFFTASRLGVTGLTVTCSVFRNGSEIVTDAAATEIGRGVYSYQLSSGSVNAEGEYIAVFATTGNVDQKEIPALWVVGKSGAENLDAAISTRLAASSYTVPPTSGEITDSVWDEMLAGHVIEGSAGDYLAMVSETEDPLLSPVPGSYPTGTAGHTLGNLDKPAVTIISPLSRSLNLEIIAGSSYINGNAISFANAESSIWPDDLDNGTLEFRYRFSDADADQTVTTLNVDLVGAAPVLSMTTVETGALESGINRYAYQLWFVADTEEETILARGYITVIAGL